jgi:hypothetical protein
VPRRRQPRRRSWAPRKANSSHLHAHLIFLRAHCLLTGDRRAAAGQSHACREADMWARRLCSRVVATAPWLAPTRPVSRTLGPCATPPLSRAPYSP